MKLKKLVLCPLLALCGLQAHAAGNFISSYIDDVVYRFALLPNGPSTLMFVIAMVIMAVYAALILLGFADDWQLTKNFSGTVSATGMKRMWVFNREPYQKVGTVLLVLLGSFVASVLTLLAVGALTYAVLWICKLLLIALVWLGYILLIGGVLALFGKEPGGCAAIIPGGLIVGFQDNIEAFGRSIVEWGFDFMQRLNLFGWTWDLFTSLWDAILLAFASPFIAFAAIAALIMLVVLLLMGAEWLIMRIYSVQRPCPSCGSTATPNYIVGGHPHPVPLHPGMYGILHQKNPATGQKVPTMLLNGKGSLERECPNCHRHIHNTGDMTYGTDIHIGIVGTRSSGKSYLLYSSLAQLKQHFGNRIEQTDLDADTNIEQNAKRVAAGAGIQTAVKDSYRAVQLMLKRLHSPIPYHLFFYDVAGEKFNVTTDSSQTAMDFYRNVQTIVFILDPTMTDYSTLPVSDELQDWLKKGHASTEVYNPEGTLSRLKEILETAGRKQKDIDFHIVCTKADLGYLPAVGLNKEGEQVHRFVTLHMGLHNFANTAEASFRRVAYHAVSATEASGIEGRNLFLELLKQRDVSV